MGSILIQYIVVVSLKSQNAEPISYLFLPQLLILVHRLLLGRCDLVRNDGFIVDEAQTEEGFQDSSNVEIQITLYVTLELLLKPIFEAAQLGELALYDVHNSIYLTEYVSYALHG